MADNATNIFETMIASLIFNASSIANLAQNATTAPLTNLRVALHTASPTDTGDLGSSEANYTGYARVDVERTSSGWTVAGSSSVTASVSPTTNITFPQCSGGTNTITHFSIGSTASSVAYIYGTVTPNISVSSGVTPRLTTATAITIT